MMEEDKPEPILQKPQTIDECVLFIGQTSTDSTRWSEEELTKINSLQSLASAGDPLASEELIKYIEKILTNFEVNIDGMSTEQLAVEVYKRAWGLDVIHDLYHDPEVYEVFVDAPDKVSVSRLGKIEPAPGIRFNNNDHVNKLVSRMIAHDQDAHFDDSHPRVYCVRKDDSRLTAFRPPLTEFTSFALRKLNAVHLDKEYLIKCGSVNENVWDMLTLLARYGAKMLFIGPPESGKTSWLRTLVSVLNHTTRIATIEADRELRLGYHYPDRSVVEMEEHSRLVGGSLEELFAGSLRLSATLLIFGEFRLEDTSAAVMAGERARRFWSTSHFSTPSEAVSGTADLLLSQNQALTHDAAIKRALRAFDTFVTVYGDLDQGIKKVLQITGAHHNGTKVEYYNLAEWKGSNNDFWEGDWEFNEKPFKELLTKMRIYGVTDKELQRVGWL